MNGEAKKRGFVTHIVIVLCAALISGAVWLVMTRTGAESIPSKYYPDFIIPEDAVSVWDDVTLRALNSRISNGNIVHMRKSDPQLYISFGKDTPRTFRSVIVKLGRSYNYDIGAVLFYPNEKGKYDGDHYEDFLLPAEEKVIYFNIPEDSYSELRLDIDTHYWIDDILVSQEEIESSFVPQEHYSVVSLIIYFITLLVFFETIAFFRKDFARLLKALWGKKFRIIAGLIAAVAVVAAALAGTYFVFQRFGIYFSWFWAVMISMCSLIMGYQVWLLLKRKPRAPVQRDPDRRWRKLLFWGAVAVFWLFIAFEWYEVARREPEVMEKLRFRFAFILAFAETFLLALLYRKYLFDADDEDRYYTKIFVMLTFVLGVAYMIVFLPFVSPDEMSHYLSAYRMSNIFMGQIGQLGDERLVMRMEDFEFYDQLYTALGPGYYIHISEIMHPFANTTGSIVVEGAMVTNAIFSYAFSGLAITIARLLNLSGVMTFYAGRMANLLFLVLVLRYLMKRLPFGKSALYAVVAIPMMLQVAATYSYDVTTFCFVALFVTRVLEMAYTERKVTKRDVSLCAFYGALMAPSKMVFLPLLFCALLIPGRRLSKNRATARRRKALIIGAGIASALLVTLAVGLLGADSSLRKIAESNTTKKMLSWVNEPAYTVSWILSSFDEFIAMYFRTLVVLADHYFFTMFGSSLGWMDIPVMHVYCLVCFVLIILAAHIREEKLDIQTVGMGPRIWVGLLCAASLALTMLAMLLSWTPVSYDYIVGVQGRYFLPLLVPIALLMTSRGVEVSGASRRLIVFFSAMVNIWVCVYIFASSLIG